jgi:hypothetical protein
MRGVQILWAVWRWVKWPLIILVAGFIVLVVWRTKVLLDQEKIGADVAAIHANRLTKEQLYGPLPQEPDPTANNATLAGIDTNNDGIRDDVERAIYFKYKDSAKASAAAFQYAKELQMEFTKVYNSDTLVTVMEEESRGSLCISDVNKKNEIRDLIFDTNSRKEWSDSIREKYMQSYGLPQDRGCDIDPKSLQN